ncbi:MAG: molybdopterin-guanine dinucleotide biosynthesis protein B [Candidatus Humimicrobiaceae bacterium]
MDKFIISVIGKSGSGKTTLIKRIIPELIKRGYKLGTIKHVHHNFEIDQPGKDSWIHKNAGAVSVLISSKNKIAFIKELDDEIPVKEIIFQFFKDIDILLIEGYKEEDFPKIEVVGRKELCKKISRSPFLLMVVSETPIDVSVPVYNPKEIIKIADFLEEEMHIFYQNY